MATLRKVKDLKTGSIPILRLLSAFVFGDTELVPYDPTKVYKKFDQIIQVNPTTGQITVLIAQAEGLTGPFDSNQWKVGTLKDSVGNTGGGGVGSTGGVEVSEVLPTTENNQVWWQIRHTEKMEDPFPEPPVVTNGGQVIAQEDQPTEEKIVLWLDIE